jgi:alkanesulfonate monooxygenase SsuD/methylene tetrahydromethanopterin reductase-like flavin-dependent oxidoreductase (luciferase family)
VIHGLAKQIATLDRLSGGRVTLGVGVGWDSTEFDAIGADFHPRGRCTDESIALLRNLFRTGRGPGGDGVFEPKPLGEIPVMVGDVSEFALRRTTKLADEWQGVGLTPDEFRAHALRLRAMTDRPIRLGTRIEWTPTGTDTAVRAFAKAGADSVALWFGPHEHYEERMTQLAAAVIAA